VKAIVKARPGPGMAVQDMPEPKPGPRDVLIRVRAGSICGTDAHIFQWDAWAQGRIKPPLIIGHEFAGEVAEVGSEVQGFRKGDPVSAEGHLVCGACALCRTGQGHICPKTRIIGVVVHGAWAELIAMPATNVWKLDPAMPWEVATLHDAMGNAFHTVMPAEVQGKTVLIQGCGPIGCFAAGVAKAAGASLILAADLNLKRLVLAERMGAQVLLNAKTEDVVAKARELTGGLGVDVVCEMSGAPAAIRQAVQAVRNGGRVRLLGLPTGEVPLKLAEDVIFKGITIEGVIGRRMYETWRQMRDFLGSGRFDPTPVITHRLQYQEFEKGLAAIADGTAGKVVLLFDAKAARGR
jgi:threonine 3-dehydrogenase